MVFKPATPGFLTTLIATILLLVVSFSVPWFKSVFFLRASLASSGVNGSITFGTLGYCTDISGNVTCSKPTVGYELDLNKLLGNSLPVQIPQVVAKWITYALVLHIVALVLAAISAVFGLLAHIREMSMSCFSSCISGMAAAVCLVAFIFDLVLFFLARARINNVKGGSAAIGNAIWFTLAAWILLFISGCMFGIGRCCIGKRPRAPRGSWGGFGRSRNDQHAETMRLDAIKAEADRKARQAAGTQEVGLPSFAQYESAPLRAKSPQYLEEEDSIEHYQDHKPAPAPAATYAPAPSRTPGSLAPQRQASGHTIASQRQPTIQEPHYTGGYVQGAPGTRAVDTTYSNVQPVAPTPVPASTAQAAPSAYPAYSQSSGYTGSASGSAYPTGSQSPQQQYTTPHGGSSQYLDPYTQQNQNTHHAQASSYHSAYSHQQHPSQYSQYPQDHVDDSYNTQPGAYGVPPELGHQQPYQDPYAAYTSNNHQNNDYDYGTGHAAAPIPTSPQAQQPYPNPYDNYGQQAQYNPYPAPIDTSATVGVAQQSRRQSVGGPRGPRSPTSPTSPPRAGWDVQQQSQTEPPPNYSFDGTSSSHPQGYPQGYPQGKR